MPVVHHRVVAGRGIQRKPSCPGHARAPELIALLFELSESGALRIGLSQLFIQFFNAVIVCQRQDLVRPLRWPPMLAALEKVGLPWQRTALGYVARRELIMIEPEWLQINGRVSHNPAGFYVGEERTSGEVLQRSYIKALWCDLPCHV